MCQDGLWVAACTITRLYTHAHPPHTLAFPHASAHNTLHPPHPTQSLWMYMATVFSGGDIVKQLPAEARRFQNIDRNFMRVCVYDVLTVDHFDR